MKIEGCITDTNQKPLPGVNVEFFDGGTLIAGVRSGSDGRFKFENDSVFPDHAIQVKASAKGYLSTEQPVAQDGTSGLILVLQPVAVPTPPPALGKYLAAAGAVLVLAALFIVFRPRPQGPSPEFDLKLNPLTVSVGELFTLEWTSKNAERVAIDPLGELPAAGNTSFVAQAAGSTNYKGVAVGNGKSSKPMEVVLNVQASPQAVLSITKLRLGSPSVQRGTQPTLFVTIQNIGNKPSGPLILRVSAKKPGLFGSVSEEAVSSVSVLTATTPSAERLSAPVASELVRATPSAASPVSRAATESLHRGVLVPAHAGVAIESELVAPFRLGRSLDLAFAGTIAPQNAPELPFKLWSDLPVGKWNINAGLVANGDNYAIGTPAPGVKAQSLTVKE